MAQTRSKRHLKKGDEEKIPLLNAVNTVITYNVAQTNDNNNKKVCENVYGKTCSVCVSQCIVSLHPKNTLRTYERKKSSFSDAG